VTVYDAAWYDTVLVEDGSPAMEPLESSPWLTTYTELARMIDPCEEVVDLGCGTGRFIELLYRREHYAQVTGIDFSQAALDEAERYAGPHTTKQSLPSSSARTSTNGSRTATGLATRFTCAAKCSSTLRTTSTSCAGCRPDIGCC